MRSFIYNNIIYICLIIIFPVYILFTFHNFYYGTDELRMTLVPMEIANKGNIYFKDNNNELYNTDSFVKPGFLINKNKEIYPFGFILNSLILVPIFAISKNRDLIINGFATMIYLSSYFTLYLIFKNLKINKATSALGAAILSLSNFYLSMYVSYFPDFLLIFYILLFINHSIKYFIIRSNTQLYLLLLLSAFLLAYKITMFPLVATLFIYLLIKLYKEDIRKTKIVKIIVIFTSLFIIYNIPQFQQYITGPSYIDFSANTTSQQLVNKVNKDNIKKIDTISRNTNKSILNIAVIFWEKFVFPKEDGKYLFMHMIKDFIFFAKNNFIIIVGLVFGLAKIYKKPKIFYLLLLVFLTSFILWGNMDAYGGADSFHLRNSHIRYMLPIFIVFYILGFYFAFKFFRKNLFIALISAFVINSILSLVSLYPFASYSLINKQGFLNKFYIDRDRIVDLNIPKDSVFLSISYDDYDLSYIYENYADIKRLSDKKNEIPILLDNIVSKKKDHVYLLIPIEDSRYSTFTKEDLEKIEEFTKSSFISRQIYTSDTKKIIKLSKK